MEIFPESNTVMIVLVFVGGILMGYAWGKGMLKPKNTKVEVKS